MMAREAIDIELRRLVCGMADQSIKKGDGFQYDGGRLLAEDVANIGLPSLLCLADRMAVKLGFGSLGYRFSFGEANPVFPLHASPNDAEPSRLFTVIAPFVADVFIHDAMECRHDLALLFERAAQVIDPDFRLASDAAYSPAPARERSEAQLTEPNLGR